MKKAITVSVLVLGLIASPALAGGHHSKGGSITGGGTANVTRSGNSSNSNVNVNGAAANAQNFNLGIASSKSTGGSKGGCWGWGHC
jgi:hypothetical protein